MCLFKPNTYDPKDWQCPKPSCRTVNFKKRTTCISCGARKPEGTHRPLDDWRDGEKTNAAPWDCENCGSNNEAGSIYCLHCKEPSTEQMKLLDEEKQRRAQEEGRGGGLYDRQDPHDKKQWDSDGEEFDEFGRRKKRRTAGAKNGAPRADPRSSAGGTSAASDKGNGRGARDADGDRGGDAATAAAKGGKAISAKHLAALERLRNKHASSTGAPRNGGRDDRDGARDSRNGRQGGRRSRSRSLSRRRH